MRSLLMTVLFAVMVVALCADRCYAAGTNIAFYRMGDGPDEAWAFLKRHFEGRGHSVAIHRGEVVVEKHVEKVSAINRSQARIFLAVELAMGEKNSVMVATTEAKKAEGRFLTIDEMPGRFAETSKNLAAEVAASFRVRVKHLPLFPLLGVNMPGIYVRLEFREDELRDMVNRLCIGVEKYSEGRIKDEKQR